ncbi:MAG: lysoplasmalogenase [Hominenteromicrobium sp.]
MAYFIWIWLGLSLPVLLMFFYIYIRTREQGRLLWRSAAKCGATFTTVMTAVLGTVLYDRPPESWILVAALALCCIADFVIECSFAGGIVSFALAHIAFIVYSLTAAEPVWYSVPIAVGLYGAAAFLFRHDLKRLGKLFVPMLVYPAVLAVMAATAVVLPFTASPRYLVFALGAAAFCVSDMFVAKDAISGITGPQRDFALLLYYGAVYAMAAVQLVG